VPVGTAVARRRGASAEVMLLLRQPRARPRLDGLRNLHPRNPWSIARRICFTDFNRPRLKRSSSSLICYSAFQLCQELNGQIVELRLCMNGWRWCRPGVALLRSARIPAEPSRAFRVVPLRAPRLARETCIATLKGKALSPAAALRAAPR
jgi:hypothetical protein